MSNWRQYPPPELEEARDWLHRQEQAYTSLQHTDSRHCRVLLNHLHELIGIYGQYVALQKYRESTKARNELAKRMFERTSAGRVEADGPEIARRCLAAADIFLEQSGEKKVVAEEVEEALREVLGWQP